MLSLEEMRKTLGNREELGDPLLRAIAAYPNWFLAVDSSNCACLWKIDDQQTLGVMTEPKGPDDRPHEYLPMRGRHLMNNLPDETEVVAFDMGTNHGISVRGEALKRLQNIASALNCEEALASPPVPSTTADLKAEVPRVLQHEWIALWDKDKPLVMPFKGLNGILIFTAFDTIDSYFRQLAEPQSFQLIHMSGSELFKILDAQTNYDGVYINPNSDLELFPFAPAQIHEIANGRQPRPERRILNGRSSAEIQHFLDESGMGDERPSVTESIDGKMVTHYTGEIITGLEPRSFRFYKGENGGPPNEWGAGASEIICAGKLADLLRRRLEILENEKPPLDENMKSFVKTALVWANELKKLIDKTTGYIPRRVVRTVDGARFLREYPHISKLQFAEDALTKLSKLL